VRKIDLGKISKKQLQDFYPFLANLFFSYMILLLTASLLIVKEKQPQFYNDVLSGADRAEKKHPH
jgi:hypothetical protein